MTEGEALRMTTAKGSLRMTGSEGLRMTGGIAKQSHLQVVLSTYAIILRYENPGYRNFLR